MHASHINVLRNIDSTIIDQKEGNGKFPQQFALSEQVCDLHPECFIIRSCAQDGATA